MKSQSRSRGMRVGMLALLVACVDSGTVEPELSGIEAPSGGVSKAVVPESYLRDECLRPRAGWIWCDDFEQNRLSEYFEHVGATSFARVTGVGTDGTPAMRARFTAGQVDAGNLKLAFGRTPQTYMDPVDAGTSDYREIYWRVYVKNAPGWTGGGGDKLTRITSFAGSNWSQAMIGHVWSGSSDPNRLVIDPASGTDTQGTLRTTGYNDFPNLRWLGSRTSTTPVFDASHVGEWYCIESRVRLNDAGQSNGVFELWVDDQLEASATGLNWVGSYSAYGLNTIFLENFWNAGSPVAQERYIDNFVVSTQRIGCGVPAGVPAPTGLTATPIAGAPDIQVSWTPGGAYDTQILERKYTSPDGSYTDANWARVRTALGGSVTGERDAGLQVGARYTYRVIGVSGGVESAPSGTAAATVGATSPVPVATVSVTPASTNLGAGATQQLTATTRDAAGNVLTGRAVSWSSSNAAIAAVSSTGLVTGGAQGSATITATSEGRSGTAQVSVAAVPVATVTVSPTSATLAPGGTRQLTATTRDASGNTLTGRVVSWSSSNSGIASVSSSGLVTAQAQGSATITATSEGRSATASITVTAPPPPPGSAPNVLEDFSTYTSTSQMISDPRGIYNNVEDIPSNMAPVVLDTQVGYGGSSRSMRYDWGNGAGTISRMLTVPNQTEVWVEWTHRFQNGYSMEWGGGGDPSYKFLHVVIDADHTNGGRFGHNFGNGDNGYSGIEGPNDDYQAGFAYTNYTLASVADGQWHTYRYHVKLGNPDLHELWVDGVLKARKTGFNTAATRIWGVALGRNQNQPPTSPQSQWWGRVQIWWGSNDPGW